MDWRLQMCEDKKGGRPEPECWYWEEMACMSQSFFKIILSRSRTPCQACISPPKVSHIDLTASWEESCTGIRMSLRIQVSLTRCTSDQGSVPAALSLYRSETAENDSTPCYYASWPACSPEPHESPVGQAIYHRAYKCSHTPHIIWK